MNGLLGGIAAAVSMTNNQWPSPALTDDGAIILEDSVAWLAHIAATLVTAPILSSLLTRRLHDIGRAAWWVNLLWVGGIALSLTELTWPGSIPVWAIIVPAFPLSLMMLAALLALSVEGDNRFGPQPASGLPKRW